MSDLGSVLKPVPRLWQRVDKAVLALVIVLLAVALLDPRGLADVMWTGAASLLHTLPYVLFAVLAVGTLKASGAEAMVAQAFHGRQVRMILFAALLGGLSPFCSCEIIPFIAGLLALGAPLSAVMALWLSSPLMDPAMFAITAGAIGLDFAVAKAVAAVAIGLMGGLVVMALAKSPIFSEPLRTQVSPSGCCSAKPTPRQTLCWAFWLEQERRAIFATAVGENFLFLLKWLALAYALEAIMLRYVPADFVGSVLGGQGTWPIVLGALLGGPAYLNGFAAVPLVGGLLQQGMNPGAAMSFVIAGGVTCIPAAVAVWALVKPRVFAAYLALGLCGALIAGFAWGAMT